MLENLKRDNKKIEEFLEWSLLWTGVATTLMGFIGVVLLSFSVMVDDRIMTMVFTFVSFYMLFFGLFLVIFHKKIIVRKKLKDPYK